MKFIKVKAEVKKTKKDLLDYESLGIKRPDDSEEFQEGFLYLSKKMLEEELFVIFEVDANKCCIEREDGFQMELLLSAEEFIELLDDSK